MISFIIIGLNEGWKLTKCIESVFETIKHNKLIDYEVIYVDSNSTDDSIKRVLKFKDVKMFKITSKPNAAIARNIGAQESNGEALIFIDGDMEIISEFLPLVYNKRHGLKYSFVSGQFINYYYDLNGNYISKKEYCSFGNGDYHDVVTGGLFCIRRDLWFHVGGMKNKYRRSQDVDLGLRLAKSGIKLLRKQETMAVHHTISYLNMKRVWKDFFKGYELYGRSLLYRDHFFDKAIFPRIFRQDYSLIIFISSVILALFTASFYPVSIYLCVVLMKGFKNRDNNEGLGIALPLYYIFRDIVVFLGLCFFFPAEQSNTEIEYKRI